MKTKFVGRKSFENYHCLVKWDNEFSALLEVRHYNFLFFSFLADNKLPYSLHEKLINAHPKCFSEILNQIITNDIDVLLVDLNYQKVVRLCQIYKNAFKIAYTNIAQVMIERNNPHLQRFLDNFLEDIKSAMKMSDFPFHYDDELINYVLILSECKIESSDIATFTLNRLKKFNYLNFVILVTHFPQFSNLLPQNS